MEGQLFAVLYAVVAALSNIQAHKGKRFSDGWVVRVHLWAVLHDRPTVWACDPLNWPEAEQWRSLPSQSTMSRRFRSVGVLSLLDRAEAAMRDRFARGGSKWIDSKPLVVGGASKDRDARAGRAVKGTARGYKLHVVMDGASGMVDAWRLAAMADNDKLVARAVLPAAAAACAAAGMPILYVAADNQYDGNELYDLLAAAAAWAPQLVVAARRAEVRAKYKGHGHRPQSPRRLRGLALSCGLDRPHNPLGRPDVPPSFGEQLLQDRAGIERRFGTMGNFGGGLGPLPNWVRTPHRVAAWVQGKLLVFMARELLKTGAKNNGLRVA